MMKVQPPARSVGFDCTVQNKIGSHFDSTGNLLFHESGKSPADGTTLNCEGKNV